MFQGVLKYSPYRPLSQVSISSFPSTVMHCVSLLRAGEPATELWPMFRGQLSARAAFFFRVKPNQPTTFYQAENSIQTLKFHTVIPVLDVVFWKFMLEKIPAI